VAEPALSNYRSSAGSSDHRGYSGALGNGSGQQRGIGGRAKMLLLITFPSIVPAGFVWAQLANLSPRKMTVENEHPQEELVAAAEARECGLAYSHRLGDTKELIHVR
jgi:hypothetical protein